MPADLKSTDNFQYLRDFLHSHLMDSIIPFWTKHAIDESGGINTCIGDDGTIINRDKWLWSQWRAVWVFSKLYNQFDHNEEWLEIARRIYQFTSRYGWDDEVGGWRLRLSHDGKVLDGCKSIYVDGVLVVSIELTASEDGKWDLKAMALKVLDGVVPALGIGTKAGIGNTAPAWGDPAVEGTFLGAMDDFRIWNLALSGMEVGILYDAEKAD